MTVFVRVSLIATAAFIVVQALPLAWLNFFLSWIIVVGAAYRYPHMILDKVQMMSSTVGFAVGMGAALGAIVNTIGMLGALVVHLVGGAIGAAGNHGHTAGALSTFSAIGDLFLIVGAPFVGAALGAIGGLVGGSTIPRSSITSLPIRP